MTLFFNGFSSEQYLFARQVSANGAAERACCASDESPGHRNAVCVHGWFRQVYLAEARHHVSRGERGATSPHGSASQPGLTGRVVRARGRALRCGVLLFSRASKSRGFLTRMAPSVGLATDFRSHTKSRWTAGISGPSVDRTRCSDSHVVPIWLVQD